MSKLYFDIKFCYSTIIINLDMSNFVSITPLFFRNFSLIYNDFIKIEEYMY